MIMSHSPPTHTHNQQPPKQKTTIKTNQPNKNIKRKRRARTSRRKGSDEVVLEEKPREEMGLVP
jgi:hypothetical protein